MIGDLLDIFWPNVCPLCARESRDGPTHSSCLDGLARAHPVRGARVIARFEDSPGWFRLLHQWKYGGQRGLARVVAASMVDSPAPVGADAILVPLPDDPRRRLERGYSPVADLAREIARLGGWKIDTSLLRRTGERPSQTSCAGDAVRARNVRGAFRTGDVARWPRERMLVIIEDQVTSGATVREAAALLGVRGAPVLVWCAARAARAPHLLDGQKGRH